MAMTDRYRGVTHLPINTTQFHVSCADSRLNMTKAGHHKRHRKQTTAISVTDVSVTDIEEDESYENTESPDTRSIAGGPEDWEDDDPRWGNPPTLAKPTIVSAKLMIAQLQDMDTVRGTLSVRIGMWCSWTDPRLAGRSRMDPLPTQLWSPRPTLGEALGEFARRTCELTIQVGSLQGEMYSLTWYEGTVKNVMDLHLFPLDTDSIALTFLASECFKRNGEVNVNYKTDYRLLFDGWMFPQSEDDSPHSAPYGWKLESTTVCYVGPEHCQDIIQIRLNLKRQVAFYFFKVVLPLMLITCLNFMGFSLETLGERLANNVSLFLSALALLYVVGQDLPHTTFLTAIDRIVLVTLLLIFTTSIHFVAMWRQTRQESYSEELDIAKGITKTKDETEVKVVGIEKKLLRLEAELHVVLAYFFGFIGYLATETIQLMIRRYKTCKEFQKNIGKNKVFLDGVDAFNKLVKEDTSFQIPAWIMVDPYKIVLVKPNDSGTLLLPQLQTKSVPSKLLLSSGKALVMSLKPAFKFGGKDVKWMTIGSQARAIEVLLDVDSHIKVFKKKKKFGINQVHL